MTRRHVLLVAVGVVAISVASVLVRLADEADAPALAIAFYRCGMAAAILVPLGLLRHGDEYRALTRRQWRLAVLSGLALAAHFGTWIPSITLTTIAASAVLVQTTPIWVALLGRFFGERPTRRGLLGVAVALAGTVVISGGGFDAGTRALIGDALALAGAIFGAIYVIFGRNLRQAVSLVTYTGIVYGTAALALGSVMLVSGTPFAGYRPEAWALFVLMTVGPQFLGHTVFNYLLAHMRAVAVSVALLAEPVGATILAFFVLAEVPAPLVLVGGVLVLAGVYIAIKAEARTDAGSASADLA
jgi:drug/metabolite transporter (DMT)-like permease